MLTKLAVSQDPAADLTPHFSTTSDAYSSCRQIDTNVFVWTGTDTQYKINVLRKLFALFGVEENMLVFYLRDEENNEAVTSSRYEIRKKYWEYALPGIRVAFGNSGPFSNVNPVTNNYVSRPNRTPIVCRRSNGSSRTRGGSLSVQKQMKYPTPKSTEELYQQDASNKKGSLPKNFSSFSRRPVVYVCTARRRRHEQDPDSSV